MDKNSHPSNNFDFLRIFAASLVLYSHHYALSGLPTSGLLGMYTWGGVAVLIFFSISGYLVAQSWFADPHIGRFFLRRILRIWPALTFIVIFCTFILGPSVTTLSMQDYFGHPETLGYLKLLYMETRFTLPGVFQNNPALPTVNGSLWTIPYEVICYILLGSLGFIGLLNSKKSLLAIAAAYLIWYAFKRLPTSAADIHAKQEFIAFFLSGSALYALQDIWSKHKKKILLALCTAAIILIYLKLKFLAVLLILPYMAIFLGTSSTPFLRNFGRWGDPSYGIYLFAFPVQQTILSFASHSLNFYTSLLISFVITIAFAYLSWHAIEKQALKFKPSRSNGEFFSFKKPYSRYRFFFCLWAGIALIYLLWLVSFWPGVIGPDSYAVMLESETQREFQSGKPIFWFLFVDFFYSPWRLVEIPIAVQMLTSSIIFTRALTWMAEQNLRKSFKFSLIFIVLAPCLVFYNGSLYSDGIYASTLACMLLEIWICSKKRSIGNISVFIFFVTIPFAIFSRPNGIANFIPLIYLLYLLQGSHRRKLAIIIIGWSALAVAGNIVHRNKHSIGTVFPLAVYETVGFLENRPMGLWEMDKPRITPRSQQALESTGKSIQEVQQFYDHYYWDPLIFRPDGPTLLSMSSSNKKIIIKDFFKYNLWHNFPAFAASRVNIFLYAAFASGGIPGSLGSTQYFLPQTKSRSIPEEYNLPTDSFFQKWLDFSMDYSKIFWTPWLGILLIISTFRKSIIARHKTAIVISGTMLLQLIAVFIFSIAGEYRYLLAFFTAPLALLPIHASLDKQKSST